jgi:hypothetical protein
MLLLLAKAPATSPAQSALAEVVRARLAEVWGSRLEEDFE